MSVINDIAIDRFVCDMLHEIGRIDRLLDLGCGARPYARHYGPLAARTIGGDYAARPGVDVRLTATALPFADASFDVVLCSEVLEHVDDAGRAVAEISRVLAPGGLLVVTVPFNYMQHEVPYDHVRFTQFGLVALLARNGLEVEVLEQRGSLLTLMVAQLEFLIRGAFEALCRLPLVGRLLRPIGRLARSVWIAAARTVWGRPMLRHRHDPRALREEPARSSRLMGPYGQLRHWTLGYCALARRVTTAP